MTELQLYKWIENNGVSWRWETNSETGEQDVILFVPVYLMDEFCNLLSGTPDGGFPCVIKDKYIAIWMDEICQYHGIELGAVFEKGFEA